MAENTEKVTASSKLNKFIEKNRKVIIGIFIGILVAVLAFVCIEIVSSNTETKGLSAIDALSFELTDGSNTLEEAELNARCDEIMEKLLPYTKKSGVAGVRADMLAAEIAYQKKDYENAANYWDLAAKKSKKSYTAPLAYYNKGVCMEALNKLDDASAAYKIASEKEGFVLRTHAIFCYARTLEMSGKFAEAGEQYKILIEKFPIDNWSNLAKTKLLNLQIEGKIE